jgi:hypothetical protein
MSKQAESSVIVFKIALKNRKSIWRRIAARSDQTLDDLHQAIFNAFDRYDEHLYSFYFPKPGAKGRDITRNSIEFTHPYNAESDSPFPTDAMNAAEAKLGALHLKAKQRILYLFDFGDSWWHEITVESVHEPVEEGDYPRVVDQGGKSPPQYPDIEEEEDEDDD